MATKENRDVVYRNAKAKEKPYKISDGKGMFLLVNSDGSKYWRLAYRFGGKQKTLALGVYPETSLEDARNKRTAARKLLDDDQDPGIAKKEKKRLAVEKAANTFEKIAREWHKTNHARWKERTASNIVRRLELDIFPHIGALPIAEISAQQMIAAIRKVEARHAHEIAHRLRAFCDRIFDYAIQQGLAANNPAKLRGVLEPLMPENYAAITVDELPAFLAAMKSNDARLFMPTRVALRLLMLTFVRTSELIEAEWSEINWDKCEWIIPWQRMKMGRKKVNPVKEDHYVFLSEQSIALLRELHTLTGRNKYLFPNQRDHEKPMSNGAILMALKRMGYKGKMTGHGFRALAMSTIMEKLRYRREVPDRQLAHKPKDKIDRAYDRAAFLSERREMMQKWADYLEGVEKGSNVIRVGFRAA